MSADLTPTPRQVLVQRRDRLVQAERGARESAGFLSLLAAGMGIGSFILFSEGSLFGGCLSAVLVAVCLFARWRKGIFIGQIKSDLEYVETIQLMEEPEQPEIDSQLRERTRLLAEKIRISNALHSEDEEL